MYRFHSIKYLAFSGMMTGLLIAIGYFSSFIFGWTITSLFGGNSTLQLFDAVFIPFVAFFEGPIMLFAGTIAGAIFDIISSVKIVVVPITIIIRILMFFVIKLLINKDWWSSFYTFFFAAILLLIYPLFYLIIYQDYAIVINELITDTIQAIVVYIISIPIYYALCKIQIKSNNHFWDDRQFDYFKKEKVIK